MRTNCGDCNRIHSVLENCPKCSPRRKGKAALIHPNGRMLTKEQVEKAFSKYSPDVNGKRRFLDELFGDPNEQTK